MLTDGARDLNVKETPSKPKRGRPTEIKRDITKTSQSGLREGLTRATFIIREDTLDKLKERAYTDRKKLKDLVTEALDYYLEKPVNDENPTLGQTSDTYDNTAVWLSGQLREHSSYTLGVLLTAVEAALGDSKQAEALKAIVRREIFLMIDRNQAEVYERANMQKPGLSPREIRVDGQDETR